MVLCDVVILCGESSCTTSHIEVANAIYIPAHLIVVHRLVLLTLKTIFFLHGFPRSGNKMGNALRAWAESNLNKVCRGLISVTFL